MAKSFKGSNSSLVNQFKTLTMNSSSANDTLAGILINDQHRYLILKYFDNERQFTITTVGNQNLTLTGTLPTLATQATLTTAWAHPSYQQLVVFNSGSGDQRPVFFTQGSTTITWQSGLTNATSAATIATMGVQSYRLPANVSKIKNDTISVGQLVYTPAPVQSVQEWTKLNALPYNSDIPAYFFVYQGELNFWPIPSTTGNIITLYCQVGVPDMTYSDYTTPGTINSMSVGSNTVTGSSTTWTSTFPANTDLTFANIFLQALPPNGDGVLYQIQSFQNGTTATLTKPVVNSPNTNGASVVIGQYPLLSPDFHDAILYGALRIYYSSIVKDPDRYNLYNGLFNEKVQLIEFYLANKSVNVDLSVTPVLTNPNLYTFAPPNS